MGRGKGVEVRDVSKRLNKGLGRVRGKRGRSRTDQKEREEARGEIAEGAREENLKDWDVDAISLRQNQGYKSTPLFEI